MYEHICKLNSLGDHCLIYTYIKLSCRLPKTNVMLCVSYISVKNKNNHETKEYIINRQYL